MGVGHHRQKVVQSQASASLEETPEKEREAFHTGRVEGKGGKPLTEKQSKHILYKIAQ